jgi:putative cell wall-binding protein
MLRTSLRTRAAAIVGGLAIAVTGTLALAPAANAVDGDATVTTTEPTLYLDLTNQAYGSITIKESAAAKLATDSSVCVTFDQTSVRFNSTGAAPTVTDDNADAAHDANATITSDGGHPNDTVRFKITHQSSGTAATWTISGLRVDVDPNPALPAITLKSGDCTAALLDGAIAGGRAEVRRIAGSTRYATSQAIAQANTTVFPCVDANAGKNFIIARGDNFPDALAASYLAGVNHVPILLTASTSLPNETIAALKNLGVQHVLIIGGTGAISQGVENVIAGMHAYNCGGTQLANTITVNRVQGTDRFETAKAVALTGGTFGTSDNGLDGGTCNAVKTAIVASGVNFPDALAAGGLANAGMNGCGHDSGPIPLLLTNTDSLPTATSSVLADNGVKQVILMGGTGAVSTNVENAIKNVGGTGNINVVRVFGGTRQETAAKLASDVLGKSDIGNFNSTRAFVSRPDEFADALAAAPLLGLFHAPLFLSASTSSLGTVASNGIKGYPIAAKFTEGDLLGGTTALADAVKNQLSDAIDGQT